MQQLHLRSECCMAHSQLLLGETPLKQQVKLPHNLGNVFLPINCVQLFEPQLSSITNQVVNVYARSLPLEAAPAVAVLHTR